MPILLPNLEPREPDGYDYLARILRREYFWLRFKKVVGSIIIIAIFLFLLFFLLSNHNNPLRQNPAYQAARVRKLM